MTPEWERKLIRTIRLSPDAFQKRSEQNSFAEQMAEVFTANKMPYPIPADDDRKHGAQYMYDVMKAGQLEIDPSCKKLIDVIPMICTEEDDPEEIEKFDGDDAWDSARYGLKDDEEPGTQPIGEEVEEKVAAYAKSRNKSVDNLDINAVASVARRARFLAAKSRSRRRGGLGRVWRPQNA
jgi:hypothetical protein